MGKCGELIKHRSALDCMVFIALMTIICAFKGLEVLLNYGTVRKTPAAGTPSHQLHSSSLHLTKRPLDP